MFMIAAVFAASAVFVSCTNDPSDAPSITVRFNGIPSNDGVHAPDNLYVGDEVEVELEFNVPGKIKEIRIARASGTGDMPPGTYPKTKDFLGETIDKVKWTITGTAVGTVKYTASVTDKDKEAQSDDAVVEITFKERPPVYGDIETFTAVLLGAQNATVGSSYATSTNTVYTVSQVLANASTIDFIYFYQAGGSLAEIFSPNSSNAATLNIIKDMNPKRDTKFKRVTMSAEDFNAITNDAKIVETAIELTESVITNLVVGDVVAFETDDNKLGLYRVSELTTGASGSITLTVKVQE